MLPEREVEVYRFEETWREGDRRGFEIECSSGTYVRSLIADLGDAYCEQLRRTRATHRLASMCRWREQAVAEAVDRLHADRQRDRAEWRTIKTLSTSGP